MPQHQVSVLVEMAAVADRLGLTADELFEQLLASDQRQGTKIVAVEMKKVEDIEDKAVTAAFAQIRLQCGKIGGAETRLDHKLAIDQGLSCREVLQCGHHALAELPGPVEAAARQELHAAGFEARLQAVAVELDLVKPALAGRSRRDECRQRRLDEIRQGSLFGSFYL